MRRYGRRAGDVVLVRPEGYVGLVAQRGEYDLVTEYRTHAGVE